MSMRTDFDFIEQWINPGSRILDLACGDGTLLKNLQLHKPVSYTHLTLPTIYSV